MSFCSYYLTRGEYISSEVPENFFLDPDCPIRIQVNPVRGEMQEAFNIRVDSDRTVRI